MKPLYTVIECETIVELTKAVNESIANDYHPLGGVSASVAHVPERDGGWAVRFYYTQAMVRSDLYADAL